MPFSVSIARNLSSPLFVVWQQYGCEEHREVWGAVPEQIALGSILDCVRSASGFLGDLRRPTTPTETVRNGGILFPLKAVLSGAKNGPQSAPSLLDSQRPLRSERVRQQAKEPFGDAVETQPDIARYVT